MTKTGKRRSSRSTRKMLRSPGRPPVVSVEARRPFWEAIAAGLSSENAAAVAGVSAPVGTRWFRQCGGMPPSHLGSSASVRSTRYLSLREREELALLHAQGGGVRAIARTLARAPSTISRELRRNAATRSGDLIYRATTAQWHADRAARRPKAPRLVAHDALRIYVADRLAGKVVAPSGRALAGPTVHWKSRRYGPRQHRRWAQAWSPEQIAHRLPLDVPDDTAMRISHEAIDQALYIRGRGALRRELTACVADLRRNSVVRSLPVPNRP
jgi:hypothetical protein